MLAVQSDSDRLLRIAEEAVEDLWEGSLFGGGYGADCAGAGVGWAIAAWHGGSCVG